jgi:FAD:protein FMN transferase
VEYFEFRAMNTDILIAAEGSPNALPSGFKQARAFVDAEEARLTRFSEQSELARLNRSAGAWFRASEALYDVARQARELSAETDGLFNPAILDALENIGYDKSMDEIRARGVSSPHAHPARAVGDFRAAQFDDAARAIRLPSGMRIDLGGIAKGWIAERAARILSDYADACAVNAGGDLFAIGVPTGEPSWHIALEDPRDPNATLGILQVGPGAVATSSTTRRRWQQGDEERHHLIDPRSGAPAESDWLSVTVIAAHAAVAEVFAKALLIAGSRQADRFAARRGDIAFVAVDAAGQLWGSRNAKEFLDVGIEYA